MFFEHNNSLLHKRKATPCLPAICSYEDDRDEGEWFLYTGSGGRDLSGNKRTNKEQSFDQVGSCTGGRLRSRMAFANDQLGFDLVGKLNSWVQLWQGERDCSHSCMLASSPCLARKEATPASHLVPYGCCCAGV